MENGTRDELLRHLADEVLRLTVAHPTRVALDGPPASGKTTLADELATVLRGRGREVVRATIDDFLVPTEQRYRRGVFSAEGCYRDAHDVETLRRTLLDPLGPGGDRRFRPACYDHASDAASSPRNQTASVAAVLVFDGVFLMRPELVDRWDLRILVSTDVDETIRRAVVRDGSTSSRTEVERRWRLRYVPAQALYAVVARPAEHADVVVVNDEPKHPAWRSRPR